MGVDNQARLTAHLLSFLHEQWPSACDFETLCSVAREKLPNADDNVLRLILADVLQGLFLRGIVTPHLVNPRSVTALSERPMLTPVARAHVGVQDVIGTPLHGMVTIRDSWVRRLVQLLDGSRSLTVITMTLLQKMQAGELRSSS